MLAISKAISPLFMGFSREIRSMQLLKEHLLLQLSGSLDKSIMQADRLTMHLVELHSQKSLLSPCSDLEEQMKPSNINELEIDMTLSWTLNLILAYQSLRQLQPTVNRQTLLKPQCSSLGLLYTYLFGLLQILCQRVPNEWQIVNIATYKLQLFQFKVLHFSQGTL